MLQQQQWLAADEAKRKAEDDDVLTEMTMSEAQVDKEDCNRKNGNRKITKTKVRRKD